MLLLWGIWALLVQLVAFFFCLIMGRIAAGMQDQLANYLRYNTETTAYRFRLTDKYPSVSRG
jgi:hypothetical protein